MRYYLILIFLFTCFNNIAQNFTEIKGVVRDSVDNKPIAFTNIYLKSNNSIGTISNQDGYFNLKISDADTIIFSCIGYNSTSISSKKSENFVEIKLKKKTIELGEVVVKPIDGTSIMSKVSSNLKNNHYLKPVYYKLFVRVWETTNNNLDIIEEYILNIYQKITLPKFKILKGRAKPFSEKETKDFKQRKLYNVIDVYTDYHLLFLSDFLKQNKFKEYNYTFLESVEIDNYICYHILCKKKESDNVIHLYVEKNSYGLAKIKVFSKNEKYTTESTKEVNYIKIDKQWYLKSSKYSYTPKNQLKKKIDRVCLYTKIDNQSKKDYQSMKKTAETQLYLYKSEFNDDFWENNNFVPIPKFIKDQMK